MDRHTIKKWLTCGLLAAVCLMAAWVALSLWQDANWTGPFRERLTFRVGAGSVAPATIKCIKEEQGRYIVYLPACADPKDVRVCLKGRQALRLGEKRVRDGMGCDAFPMNEPLKVALEGDDRALTVTFIPSGGAATMFVDTATGSMSEIHADKAHKENASVTLFDADGALAYRSLGADKLRGHGQSSWKKRKKPYNLDLDQPAGLLGMAAASKWVLISNFMDRSNLRNWLVYSCAARLGGEGWFAPGCAFVDLYLNGQYNGLYLLCEKVEIAPGRLEPPADSWLFDIDLLNRISTLKNAFSFDEGLAVEIKRPDPCDEGQKEALRSRLTDFESALMAEDGVSPATGTAWSDFIDLDSFARKYLVEEVFENYDVGSCSQYFVWNGDDGRFHAGPCWDYDRAIAATLQKTPNCFLAQREYKAAQWHTPMFHFLWQQEPFRRRTIELYREEFLPVLSALMEAELPRQAERIRGAVGANDRRWGESDYDGAVASMTAFLEARVAFLNSAWIDGVEYRTITFGLDESKDYQFFCVPAGSSCRGIPTPADFGMEGDFYWSLEDGTAFDPDTVLTGDIFLQASPITDAED